MARGHVASASAQIGEPVLQPVEEHLGCHDPDHRSRQLDRQWEAVELAADGGDRRRRALVELEIRSHGTCRLHEELDGGILAHASGRGALGRHRQGRHGVLAFSPQAKRGAARGDDRQPFTHLDQLGDDHGT